MQNLMHYCIFRNRRIEWDQILYSSHIHSHNIHRVCSLPRRRWYIFTARLNRNRTARGFPMRHRFVRTGRGSPGAQLNEILQCANRNCNSKCNCICKSESLYPGCVEEVKIAEMFGISHEAATVRRVFGGKVIMVGQTMMHVRFPEMWCMCMSHKESWTENYYFCCRKKIRFWTTTFLVFSHCHPISDKVTVVYSSISVSILIFFL